jgi:DNA-binding IclR family transcriptional regulator
MEVDTICRNMPNVPHPVTPVSGVRVLDRTMAILDAVRAGEHTFTQVRRAAGLSPSTTHRLLAALEEHGLLMFVGGYGYRLGPRLLGLAASARRDMPLRERAHPILENLARSTGEGAQLYVRSGDRRVCLDSVESGSELRTIVEIGAELPLNAGSAGKVFLAWAPGPDADRLIAEAEALTERTPVGDRLDQQVATARRLGYATSAGERQAGVGSVSAPVLDPVGGLVAVVSVSGPESRLGRISAKRFAPAVVTAAHEIERALGA